MKKTYFFIIFLTGIYSFLMGEPSLIIDQNSSLWDNIELRYLEDIQGKLKISDITNPVYQGKFKLTERRIPNFGFSKSAYWITFTISNSSSSTFNGYLKYSYPHMDYLDYYYEQKPGVFIRKSVGDRLAFSTREVLHQNFIFPLTIKTKAMSRVFLRLKTKGSMRIPIRIFTSKRLIQLISLERMIYGIFFGALMVMFLYNLLLFFSLKDLNYFYYSFWILAYTFFQSTLSGFSFQYLWPDHPNWANNCLPLFIFFSAILAFQFSRSFLELKNLSPKLDKLFISFMILLGVGIALTFADYSRAIRISTGVWLLVPVFLLYAGIRVLIIGFRAARYYLVAWFVLLMGTAVYAMKTFAIIPDNWWTNNSILIGAIIEVVLLALALGDRINFMKKERETTSKLAKYLSPQVYRSIFTGKKEVKIQASRKKLTIFFSDIKGFTETTDSMESEALTRLLNEYFNEMSKIALKHGGTIDKFIGDALMVFFGDPDSRGEKNDALACVEMALEMQNRMKYLQAKWIKEGFSKPLRIRCGINTGYATVGNFGSDERMDYTIIGNQVNLANRLEAQAGVDEILISNETHALVKEVVECKKKQILKLKGFAYPVQTWQVTGIREEALDRKTMTFDQEGFMMVLDNTSIKNKKEIKSLLKRAMDNLS